MHISDAGGAVVAKDIEQAFSSIDTALLDAHRLGVSTLEANADSSVPPARLHKALVYLHDGLGKVLDGRGDLISYQKSVISLKQASNLEHVNYGCFHWASGAQKAETAQVDSA